MKKNILVFGASSSENSINARFAWFAANQLENIKITLVDLNDFELPIYSIDLEKEIGIPESAARFVSLIKESDGVVASFAEHNGLFTSVFKNLWDWMSRLGTPKIWHDKPMFLLAASPSRRPESNVMKVSKYLFPLFGANIISSCSLPSFNHIFVNDEIIDPLVKARFEAELAAFQSHLANI